MDDEVVRMWKEAITVPYKALSCRLYEGTDKNKEKRHRKSRKSSIQGGVGTRKLSNVKGGGALFAHQEVCYMCSSHILRQGCDVFEI